MLVPLKQRVLLVTATQHIRQQIENLFAGQFVQHAFGHDADFARGAFFDVGFQHHGDLVGGGRVVDELQGVAGFFDDEAGQDLTRSQ